MFLRFPTVGGDKLLIFSESYTKCNDGLGLIIDDNRTYPTVFTRANL